MDNTLLELHPAPQGIAASDGLRQLHASLDLLLAPREPASDAKGVAAPALAACTLLRYRLAVRGWVSPGNLLVGILESEADNALRTVGQEVELAERMRAGQWFMTLMARKRVFASADHALLWNASERLHAHDDSDPIRLAVRLAMEASADAPNGRSDALLQRVERQSGEVLRELSRMVAWGSAIPGLDALAAAAGAQQKRKERDRELNAVSATLIFGRDSEQEKIREFLRQPANPQQVRTLYVSGIGGSGKSTLLLAAEKELRERGEALVVRLDFDSAYLDPLSPEQMDVMFLRALAVEEPGLAPALQRIILQLQSLAEHRLSARIDAEGDTMPSASLNTGRYGGIKRAKYATKSGSDAERAGISEKYERLSALHPLSSMPEFRQRGVVLFLDTVENVSRLGADAVNSVLEWLSSLAHCLPGRNIRVVLAGRDALGAPDMRALARLFQEHGLELGAGKDVNLGDLDTGPAFEMLKYCGMPADDAALAAAALPRNPLVLRLAANAYGAAKADVVTTIQQDYRAGRIDRQTASGYLAQRVIQHVPREPARRYAVAALALQTVTERQLRDIVIPAVDGVTVADRKLARKVYDGLLHSTWLTVEKRPGTLLWHTELRNLALPMIEADPEHAEVNKRVHATAAVWHGQQQSRSERALAEFHHAKAVTRTFPERVLDYESSQSFRVANLFPREAAGQLKAGLDAEFRKADDELHRLRLEGVGGSAGEGERLVAQGRGPLALATYRARPTRASGIPPTFVIRALAQTGDWDNEDVHRDKVLEELRLHFAMRGGNMQRPMVERLYWLTRLEMLRGGELCRSHIEMLRDACRRLKFKAQDGALFGLVGTAEALHSATDGLSLIAPAAWPPPRTDVGPELRFSMVRTVFGQLSSQETSNRWISTTLGAMILLDEHWGDELIQLSRQEFLQVAGGESFLEEIKAHITGLRSAPLVEVEQFISSCRDVPVHINLSRVEPWIAANILRGTLVEFHSPLATLLTADSLQLSLSRLMRFVQELILPPSAVLTLAEFTSEDRRESHERNLQAAVSAVIVMLDRARALGEFCRQLVRDPSKLLNPNDPKATQRVLDLSGCYMAWDRALNPHAATAVRKDRS